MGTRREIEKAIQALLAKSREFSSSELTQYTSRSRQALHRHLSRAVQEGWLVREGRGPATRYRAADSDDYERTYQVAGLSEDMVAGELKDWLGEVEVVRTRSADKVLSYAVTELVNNAIDHSGASDVLVRCTVEGELLRISIVDTGIGAFENLRSRLHLQDHLHAIQELSKGKTTTDPEHHSGEGIFFTSKMVDRFELAANGFAWILDSTIPDEALRETDPEPGTRVEIRVRADSQLSPTTVFERYTHGFKFDTTRTVVRLFEYGVDFVSRSEAKRLLANLERFREVLLDFRGVQGVGQGFADEIFRVWAGVHPEVKLVPLEMNTAVEFMVRRALAHARPTE